MPAHLKPKPMLHDAPEPPFEPSDEEGEEIEIDGEEELVEAPLLEMEISRPDFKFTIKIAGEDIDKAKNVALELFEKTIRKL